MPSQLPQLNVRVQPAVVDRLESLRAALAEERGHPVSQSEAVSYAVTRAARVAKKIKKKPKPH